MTGNGPGGSGVKTLARRMVPSRIVAGTSFCTVKVQVSPSACETWFCLIAIAPARITPIATHIERN